MVSDERTLMPTDEDIVKSLACFDFESPERSDDQMVITCRRVWYEKHPILYVARDYDGEFQFLCGTENHDRESQIVHVHLKHVLERGPEQLQDFTHLRKGYSARHVDGETWNLDQLAVE